MGEPDTPEVVDAKTKKIIELRKINIRRVTVKELSDRIEAAWKRERGNAVAMREACVNIVEYARSARCHTDDAHVLGFLDQIARWAQAALAAPPRNCDVGTVDEQAERFHNFCVSNSSSIDGMCDPKCPFIENTDKCHCLCEWEQMPYKAEKGGAR